MLKGTKRVRGPEEQGGDPPRKICAAACRDQKGTQDSTHTCEGAEERQNTKDQDQLSTQARNTGEEEKK